MSDLAVPVVERRSQPECSAHRGGRLSRASRAA